MIKVKILWKVKPDKLEWQNKSFKDKMAALQFCIVHKNSVFGVNDVRFKFVPACISINGEYVVEPVHNYEIARALGGI